MALIRARKFQPDEEIFDRIQKAGQEFGATTGRVRQCNWINLGEVKQAIAMNGVNRLVVNKMDVLREVDCWGTTDRRIHSERFFRQHLDRELHNGLGIDKIYFSDNPENIFEETPLPYEGPRTWSPDYSYAMTT